MHPRFLQSMIHSEKSSVLADWQSYQTNVLAALASATSFVDFNDHLIREFNRRVYNLRFFSLLITPYDAGFRLAGLTVNQLN